MKRKIAIAVLTCLTPLCLARAQPVPAPEHDILEKILETGLYLQGYSELEAEQNRSGFDKNTLDLARSFVLGSASSYEPPSSHASCAQTAASTLPSDMQLLDALPEIRRAARDKRVVIINEDHLNPRHRAFALEVARNLRSLGFRHLAIEALISDPIDTASESEMRTLSDRGYAVHSTGVYTNEPMFADFLAQAIRLGYSLHAYDQAAPRTAPDRVAAREQLQAETIARRILSRDPTSRVLIYVGFRHATERPFDGGLGRDMEWMASRLRRITGLDPLTIDQREYLPPACLSDALVRRARRASRFGNVIAKRNGTFFGIGSYGGAVDLQVLHFPVAPISGRPAWMTQVGRRSVPVPRALLGGTSRRLVQAFSPGASSDAVPIDQILVEPGAISVPPLMVRSERPRVEVQVVEPTR